MEGARRCRQDRAMDDTRYRLGPGQSALRRGRVSTPGRIYLVTFATRGRDPLFAEHEVARTCARAIVDPQLWLRSRLLAWVLMPDHWHGLLALGNDDELSRRVGLLKSNSSRAVAELLPDSPAVWARSFHDRVLPDQSTSLFHAANYLVMNPVRAGLVTKVGAYPYWDSVWLRRRITRTTDVRTVCESHTVGAA